MTRVSFAFKILAVLFVAISAKAAPRVVVKPEAVDRAGVIVELDEQGKLAGVQALRDAHGKRVPLQRSGDGRVQFVLAQVGAGESPEFTLEAAAAGRVNEPVVRVTKTDALLRLSIGGAEFFDYWMAERPFPREGMSPLYSRSGFIHPVRTPRGAVVTASYPADHLHHHGIWSPWTSTRFQGRTPDFWNMGKGTGKVEFAALDRSWDGTVHGGFVVQHHFIDLSAPSPTVALNETWEVTVYPEMGAGSQVRVFDLKITQTTGTQDKLELPEYHYGGLGLRGPEPWLGAEAARFLTSEGETDRVKGNATRVRWYHLSGVLDGALAGTAVLGHPENFRAPQPLRIHPKEPYACFTPSQLGDWAIEPGKPYVARYRFVVADGAPERAALESYWQGYAHPGEAQLID